MPEISVIVPVYNAEKYLKRCIDSILVQTYDDFELILVDDGSFDASGRLCDKFQKLDKRIKVFHQVNRGQAVARNIAIQNSKGSYVCFVDSDDVIHPQMLEIMYNALKQAAAEMCLCGAIESDSIPLNFFRNYKVNKGEIILINDETMGDLCTNGEYRYWVVWGKLVDKNIVDSIPFPEGRIYEDNAVVSKWIYAAGKVVNLDEELYFYQTNFSGTTKKAFSIQHIDALWALEQQIQFFDSIHYTEMLTIICSKYLVMSAIYYRKVIEKLDDRKVAKEIKKNFKAIRKKYHKYISLTKEDVYNIIDMFHPKMITFYSKLKYRNK